jgi:hypothetical protein
LRVTPHATILSPIPGTVADSSIAFMRSVDPRRGDAGNHA